MKLAWNEDLAIGIQAIDEQHKELFNRFGKMLEACNSGCGREEIGNLLLFLNDYVHTHFRDEERLQQSKGFPDYAAHCEQHRIFIGKLNQLDLTLKDGGASLTLIISANNMLLDWLVNHIAVMDKKIGQFLAANGARND